MSVLSASSLPRAFKCLASVLHIRSEFQTQWADLGKERHKADQDAVNAGDHSTLPAEVSDRIVGMETFAEVAFAVDPVNRTARIIGYGIDRDYKDLGPTEIPGTADLVAVASDESGKVTRVFIGDRKGYEEVEHPNENKQTLFYAVAAHLCFSVDECEVAIYGAVGAPKFANLDLLDFDGFLAELAAIQSKSVPASEITKHEVTGDHCMYCHAFERCGKQNALALQVESGEIDKRLAKLLDLEDDEVAGRFYVFASKLEQLTKRVNARLYARAAQRPIPVPGTNLVFGKRMKPGKRTLDADKTIQAIREIIGLDGAAKWEQLAIERSTSQAAIERAAQKHAPKGQIGRLKEQIVERVEKLGGIDRKPTESYEEYPLNVLDVAANH